MGAAAAVTAWRATPGCGRRPAASCPGRWNLSAPLAAPPSALEVTASGQVHLFGPRIAAAILLARCCLLPTLRTTSCSPSHTAGEPISQGQARDVPAIPAADTPERAG
jgi:hypothetical protein